VRSYGWLAVALATALTACSGGRGAGTLPATDQTASPSDSVRQIECHVGAPPPSGGPPPSSGSYKVCLGSSAVLNGVSDGERVVSAESADPKVVTVVPEAAREGETLRTSDGHREFQFEVTAVGLGSTTVTLHDADGRTGRVTVVVMNCPGSATPTAAPTPTAIATPPGRITPPTPTPTATATPTPAPTATATPTPAPTATPSPTPTVVPTATPSPTPTASPSPSPAASTCPLSSKRSVRGQRGTQTGTVAVC